MNEELYSTLNNLLSLLRASNAVELVRKYYAEYGNTAPPELMKDYIDELEIMLVKYQNELRYRLSK